MSAGLQLLTLAPRVTEADGVLRATTPLLLRILGLGLFGREVVVDSRARYVTMNERWFGLIRRRRVIPFKHIHRIEYEHRAVATSLRRGFAGTVRSGDEIESFSVGLVLRTRAEVPDSHAHLYEQRVHLFGFHGESRGEVWGPSLEGQQGSRSREYVERLRALTGVGFGHELPALADGLGRRWRCSGCARPAPPRPGSCYYCGANLEPERS